MKKSIFAIAGLLLVFGLPTQVYAADIANRSYEAEGLEHGISESGLTGLTHVISPYTIGTGIAGTINAGMQPISGTGNTVILYPSVTFGLGSRLELSGRTALINSPALSTNGDTEISIKYRFRSLGEAMPAMALVATAILPTAGGGAEDVNTASGRVFLVAGGDVQVTENAIIGIYANFGVNWIDPGLATQNNYNTYGLGIMAPLGDNDRFRGYIEYNMNHGKTSNTIIGRDWNGHMTVGVRYVTKLLKVSVGFENGWSGSDVMMGGVTFGF